jgi:Caspase domain
MSLRRGKSILAHVLRPRRMLLVVALSWATVLTAEEPFKLYFIAVGSTIYLPPPTKDLHGFHQLDGMNTSARLVADRLQRSGGVFGVLLTSDTDRGLAVGLPDIKAALERIRSKLGQAPPKDVLLVFYFAGHGISEGIAWNHFSVPGNLVVRGAIADLSIDELALKTLHAASLADEIEKLGVRYVVLLDTCYEGTETSFESPVLTGMAIKNLTDAAAVLKFINEFHQPNPVLFSTVPGTTTTPVEDPTDPQSAVGKLGRRLVLTIDRAAHSRRGVSLGDFVHSMTSSTLDPVTSPAVTNAEQDSAWSRSLVLGADATKLQVTSWSKKSRMTLLAASRECWSTLFNIVTAAALLFD